MPSLIQFIRKNIDPEVYYKRMFPDIHWSAGNDEARVLSPFTEEEIPSLSINRDTGAWWSFCASDEQGGSSIVSFHAAYYDYNTKEAAQDLFQQFIHPIVPNQKINQWLKKLYHTPTAISYLRKRLLSKRVIQQYKLGWSGTKFTIPIPNEFGLFINVKLCNPLATGKIPKMLNYTDSKEERSYGSPTMLFPLSIFENLGEYICICEGEWDTLALLSLGIPAVTATTGAKSWPRYYNNLFKDKRAIVIYDNDEDGLLGTKKVFAQLAGTAREIKRIIIPKKYGKDVTDYMTNNKLMRSREAWQRLFNRTKPLVESKKEFIKEETDRAIVVSLDQASQSKWYGYRLQVEALITGKDISPYLLPKKFRVTCSEDCENCPISKDGIGLKECEVDMLSTDILTMIDATQKANRIKMLNLVGISSISNCKAKVEVIETFNVEQLFLIPTLSSESKEYVVRPAYYIGHGLKANKAYQLEGTLTFHPKDHHTIHLFDSSKPVQDEIESYELTKIAKKRLVRFRPRNLPLLAHLISLAEWQSRNVTKILERPDLHIAVDLAFHSVQSFWFNREFVHRAMLDILVLGDTRCGKGYVTEGLTRYYKLGEIASGDSCSFAGLVGGLQQMGNNWRITWGLVPLNNKRLVIIDETSSLSEKDIGRMSRIRSEGVAEIVKIIRESTQANTRLIWLANPRSGRPLSSYNTGIEAVKELIGAIEDISRFDFILTLASNEVASEIINTPSTYSTEDVNKYPQELCQSLILWAWSRTSEQIRFTDKATRRIIKLAIELGHAYSSIIPLVQAENIRLKIAKISAAIAARTFSTDESHENLIIKREHVECAGQILKMFYNKPSMAYDLFSKTTMAASQIGELENVEGTIEELSQDKLSTIIGLLELHRITPDNLSDYVGDGVTAKTLVGELVQLRCLSRIEGSNWYLKNPLFTKWLRKIKKQMVRRVRNK